MKYELFIDEARKLWKDITQTNESAIIPLQLELELYKKLLVYYQLGPSCYLIFNFQTTEFDFVSEDVKLLLGYPADAINTGVFMENIHPDERMWFLNCQQTAGVFITGLSPEKQLKYKLQIDYRMKNAGGKYIRIMQQSVVIANDEEGNILRTLIILTDISHIKKEGKPNMSYIGMDGEPCYPDVDVKGLVLQENQLLSKREREIIYLMAEGKLSKEIAGELHITKYTVDTHRKNMLRKAGVKSTAELIKKAIREGLI